MLSSCTEYLRGTCYRVAALSCVCTSVTIVGLMSSQSNKLSSFSKKYNIKYDFYSTNREFKIYTTGSIKNLPNSLQLY